MNPGILVDSSAWIRHIRYGDAIVDRALAEGVAIGHLDVAGEIAMGTGDHAGRFRDIILQLALIEPVERSELFALVVSMQMNGRGVGWIDAGIIAACLRSNPPTPLYTRDRRMGELAAIIGVPVIRPSPDQ
jgi:hypothetical protein